MKVAFYKYHGTGNDFILMDNRNSAISLDKKAIANLCHRQFGIGADGLMLLQSKVGYDFEMVYYNSDGNESTFCGNGSRCIVAFAKHIGVITGNETNFIATDGKHQAKIKDNIVSVKMKDVQNLELVDGNYVLDTGSPHFVKFTEGVKTADMITEGRKVRYSDAYKTDGINVNLAEKNGKGIYVRTYERGVENETLSCGTGVTATAIASAVKGVATSTDSCNIITPGGELLVSFNREEGNSFSNIWLEGPAIFVFKGEIEI